MKSRVIGIFGAGGHGIETLSILRSNNEHLQFKVVFVETRPRLNNILGVDLISESEFLQMPAIEKFFVVALGNPLDRKGVSARLVANGLSSINLISYNSHIDSNAKIGQGAIVSPFAFISTNVSIGDFFVGNARINISHDCKIGDYVTMSPGAICNGHVVIEDNAYIGSGAVIRNGTRTNPLVIGKNAIVGMGSVVVKNVAPNSIVYGNPAKSQLN